MLVARPLASLGELYKTAEELWLSLDPSDWLDAFSKHPKIGERNNLSPWSAVEQRGMDDAAAATAARLAQKNTEYQQKFGWIFLICATGKSAAEMLSALEERLHRDREPELRTAAAEQAKITRLRLQKALNL
jgi:OHCU decarboxylase